MSTMVGFFINPSPKSLSDLKNDGLYMSYREYDLSSLQNKLDLSSGSIITNISLEITSPYSDSTFEITSDSGEVIFSKEINDPNITGTYSSNVFFEVNNDSDLIVTHVNNTTGSGILRIELYEVIKSYDFLQTSDGQNYYTADNQSIDSVNES